MLKIGCDNLDAKDLVTLSKPNCFKYGNTALGIACKQGYLAIVKLLVKGGANVNIANRYSNTPVHIAAMNGHSEIVEFLVESRADIMRENYVSIKY